MTWQNVTISSKFENLSGIRDTIYNNLVSNGWNRSSTFPVMLVLDELISNAIKHGNSFDSSKKVHISYNVTNDYIEVKIADEGIGLFPKKIKTIDEIPIDSDSGRGIFLVEHLVDTLEFNQKEKMVTFVKKRDNNE